jgi:hypothetical protein
MAAVQDELKIIPMTGKDEDPGFGFVFTALRNSLRKQYDKLSDAEYFKKVGAEIASILKAANTTSIIVSYTKSDTDPDLQGEYLGCAVTQPHKLIYVYVKKAYRRCGLARYMLDNLPDDIHAFHYSSHKSGFNEWLRQRYSRKAA